LEKIKELDARDTIVYLIIIGMLLYIWVISNSPSLDEKGLYTLILGLFAEVRLKVSSNSIDIKWLKDRTEKMGENIDLIPVIKNDINWIKEELKKR